jgi:hypothetical protein
MRVKGAAVGLGSMFLLLGACDAGNSDVNIGGEGAGNSNGTNNGGSMGAFVGGSGVGGDVGEPCFGPDCLGDTPQGNCDDNVQLDPSDAFDGARAIGLCQKSDGTTWGVTSAAWVRSDGQPLTGDLAVGKGVLGGFGSSVSALEGTKLLALSTGTARQPSDAGYQTVGGWWKDCGGDPLSCAFNPPNPHGTPPGWPKESPSCGSVQTGEAYDSAGLKVELKTPRDARSFKYNLKFYSYEFPGYICTEFNDFFVAIVNPPPTGALDGNISFDSQNNPISVNAGFLDVCRPQMAGGKNYDCAAGYNELMGTGYDEQDPGSAATTWLETTAPVDSPGSNLTLLFTIWDSGDGILDSTILIDNFRFDVKGGTTGTIPK